MQERVETKEIDRINQLINEKPDELKFDQNYGLSNIVLKMQDKDQNSKYILIRTDKFLDSGENGSVYIAQPLILNNGQYEIGDEERVVKQISGNNLFGMMKQLCGRLSKRQWEYVIDFQDKNSTFCSLSQENLHFIDMAMIPGSFLKSGGGLRSKPIQDRLDVFCQLFEQLSVMHGKKIAHKDMTENNIMYDKKTNCAKLFDFDRSGPDDENSYKTIAVGILGEKGFGRDIVSMCSILLGFLHPDRETHLFESKEEEELHDFFKNVIETNYNFARGKSPTHYTAESISVVLKEKLIKMTTLAENIEAPKSTAQTQYRFWKLAPEKIQELDININNQGVTI